MARNDPPSPTDRAAHQVSLARTLIRTGVDELRRETRPDPDALALFGMATGVLVNDVADLLDTAGQVTRGMDSSPTTAMVHGLANHAVNTARVQLKGGAAALAQFAGHLGRLSEAAATVGRVMVLPHDKPVELPEHLRQVRPPVMQRVVLVVFDFARSLPADRTAATVVESAWNADILQHELWAGGSHIIYNQEAAWFISRSGWPMVRVWLDMYGGTATVQTVMARPGTPVPTDRQWFALPEEPETLRADTSDEERLAELVDQAFAEHPKPGVHGPSRLTT